MAAVKQAEFNTQNAIKSISDLKEMVKKLKSEMEQLTIGTDEYKKKAEELAGTQEQLNSVQQYAQKGLVSLKGSYNALSYEMATLKKQYHATADAAERADLAKKISGLNDQLKEMDANVGVFSRNVGNYQSAFEALGNTGMGAVTKGMNGIKGAADILVKHPIIAIIAIVLTTIMKIADAVKKNEEAMNKLKVAFAPLNAVMDVFKNVLDIVTNKIADLTVKLSGGLSKAIKNVIQWIAKGAEALGMDGIAGALNNIEQQMQDNIKIAQDELKLQQQRRDVVKQNAESELRLAKLRKQFEEAEGDKVKQAELSKKIADEENAIRVRNYKLAKAEYDQIKLKNAQTQSGTADLDAENDAYAKMLQAQSQLYNLTSEQKKVIKENVKELKSEQTEIEKLVKSLNEWNAKYIVDNQTLEESKKALKKKYDEELQLLKDNEEAKKLLTKKYNAELDELNKKLLDKQKKEMSEHIKQLIDDTNTLMAQMIENNTGQVLFTSVDKSIRQVALNIVSKFQNEEITDEQTKALLRGLGIGEEEITQAMENAIVHTGLEHVKEAIANTADTFSNLLTFSDAISDKWNNVFNGLINGITATQEALKNSEKGFGKWASVGSIACQTLSAAFMAMADQQDATTEEGFEQQKNLQVAAATMAMLSGITMAISGLFTTKSGPWDIAIAAVQAAAIAASGAIQIASIKKQTLGGNTPTPSVSANATSATITPPVQYSSAVQGASTEDVLADQRIYVSVQEINDVQSRVSTQVNESRY